MKLHYYNTLWTAWGVGTLVEVGKLYADLAAPWEPILGVLAVGVAVFAVRNYMRAG